MAHVKRPALLTILTTFTWFFPYLIWTKTRTRYTCTYSSNQLIGMTRMAFFSHTLVGYAYDKSYLSYVRNVKHMLPFRDSTTYSVKLLDSQVEHKPIITSQNASYTGQAHSRHTENVNATNCQMPNTHSPTSRRILCTVSKKQDTWFLPLHALAM